MDTKERILEEKSKVIDQHSKVVSRRKKLVELNHKIHIEKFTDVYMRRYLLGEIIKVGYTKPKSNKSLTLNLNRRINHGTKVEFVMITDVANFGFNEWIKIMKLTENYKGLLCKE